MSLFSDCCRFARRIPGLAAKGVRHPGHVLRSILFKTAGLLFPDRLLVPRLAHSKARMWVTPRDPGLSQQLYVWGWREPVETACVQSSVSAGQVVVDIGANLGFYVLIEAELVGNTGRILAIEPSASNVALLAKNVNENGYDDRVTIVEGAVSNATGSGTLFLTRHFNLNSMNAGRLEKFTDIVGRSEVKTYRLDDLLSSQGFELAKINFVRMDVEGHEVDVIRGMPALLEGAPELSILMEVHPELIKDKYGDSGYLEMLATLEAANMEICEIGINFTCRESRASSSHKTYQDLHDTEDVYSLFVRKRLSNCEL
ncbi:MAG: FkbM family methyltransferase [Verrucomicrobiales bacterium]|nr:FkbM family methyltransferase [Verrucomicrobiales bacterium]